MTRKPAGHRVENGDAFDLVHARVLRFFPELVADLGGEYRGLLRQVGIDGTCLDQASPGITYSQFVGLLEVAANELDCPDFGLRLAKRQHGSGTFGPLGHVMKNSRTFGEALNYATSHVYAHSLAVWVWAQRSPSGKTVFLGHDILLDGFPCRSQALELLMLAGHLGALEITGGQVGVRLVHFRHQQISPLRTYRQYFGCEVRFGQTEDGVVYYESDLACPTVGSDANALMQMTAFIDREFKQHRPPMHARVRSVIMHLLSKGHCTNQHVADELNVHLRTLHRRLRSEGTSFQQVKDEVRRDFMQYYVQRTDFDFTWISERLGFAEQSVMTRNCNRWFSLSPTGLRLQARRQH